VDIGVSLSSVIAVETSAPVDYRPAMRSSPPSRSTSALFVAIVVAGLVACDRAPSAAGLPEWNAADHDRAEEKAREAQGQKVVDPASRPANSARKGDEEARLADLAWNKQCVTCHGELGRGDGPTGPMVQATNLSDPAWQDKIKDEEIVVVLKNGKGKMPKFDLPEKAIAGLVIKIRTLRQK
jgi:cytochrome c oxidase cbb3-type subunit 3